MGEGWAVGGQEHPMAVAGAALGAVAWACLLEGRGMGNIWWRRKASGRKGLSLGGLWVFAVAPLTRPRLMWQPAMLRHNIVVMVALGAAGGWAAARRALPSAAAAAAAAAAAEVVTP